MSPTKYETPVRNCRSGWLRYHLGQLMVSIKERPSSARAIGLLLVVLPGSSLLIPLWALWLGRRKPKGAWGYPADHHA